MVDGTVELKPGEIELFIKYPHILGHWLGYDLLTDIHSEWIKYGWCSNDNVAIQAHRNSYKTTAILVVGTLWYLTFYNANERILFLRKSWDEAVGIVKEIKQQFESVPMQIIFKEALKVNQVQGDTWRDSALNIYTREKITKEPNVACLGVGGNLTGAHYTKIFADDIITIKDRISRAERENTKTFIRELINIPVVGGTITYSGTPWHDNDGWTLLPEPIKYPVGTMEIPGLTEEKIAEYRRQLGASLFAANYELRHVADEDKLFADPKYDDWPTHFKKIQGWIDPSYEGKASTAMTLIGITSDDRPFIRGWVWFKHIVDCYNVILEKLDLYKVGSCFIETNADKGYSRRDLGSKRAGMIGRNETANKHIKIISFLKQNWGLLYFAKDIQPEYMNQVLDYNEDAEFKDAPDSAASLIREMRIGKKSILERF